MFVLARCIRIGVLTQTQTKLKFISAKLGPNQYKTQSDQAMRRLSRDAEDSSWLLKVVSGDVLATAPKFVCDMACVACSLICASLVKLRTCSYCTDATSVSL